MAISRSEARKLGLNSLEIGAHVIRGILTVGPDGVKVDETDVAEWLTQHAESELMLIAAPIGTIGLEREVRSCYTCGRDYEGTTCPHCAEVRARLRGS